jgi:two-component system invasion response regulator UvrY
MERLVLIDDNDAVRSILRRSLNASQGIEVDREASGGLTGIEVVKKQRPDIVVDCATVGMDGVETTRRLRSAYTLVDSRTWVRRM